MSYKSLYFPKLTRRSRYRFRSQYSDYRQEIRTDCQGRCVYCDIHENEVGGAESMTLDHFRPRKYFKDLEHTPTNLVWSCLQCNRYKQSYWPAIGIIDKTVNGNKGFIDPFKDDPKAYFDIIPNGQFVALKDPAEYMIKTLKLNRSGAKMIREKRNKKYESLQQIKATFPRLINDVEALLSRDAISEENKQELRTHKKELERQYRIAILNIDLDFALHE